MSCLFNSLQQFVPENSNQIRRVICDYLEQNRPIIDGLDTQFILRMDRPDYVAQMRRNSTWGGAIEIQAACNIWNMSVHVFDIRRNRGAADIIKFIPVVGEFDRVISVNWSGGHYTPRNNTNL
jgi:hypothetical protein